MGFILGTNEFDDSGALVNDIHGKLVSDYFSKIYLEMDGRTLKKATDLKISEEEVRSLNAEVDISKDPRVAFKKGNNQKK